jgi:hypothetical protein
MDRRRAKPSEAKSLLYTPQKGDEFVVCVNNHERFCVWSPNKDVMLLFVNPPKGQRVARMPGLSRNPMAEAHDQDRMSPVIFPKWFIRTPGKRPNVKEWPKHAHYLWGALHVNAWRNPETSLSVHFGAQNLHEFPFSLHQYFSGTDRSTIQHAVREAVVRGTFRNHPGKKQVKMGIHSPQIGVTGPRIEDLPQLRSELDRLLQNPRLMSKVKEQRELDLSFLANLQHNPQ